MELSRLGNWETSERETLVRRLRRTVQAAPGNEERLWNELLRRLEESLSPLTTHEAVKVMGIQRHPEMVSQIATRLRDKVEAASQTFIPDPGVYLSMQTYAIQAKQDPPAGWKQSVGPSIGLLLADAADIFVGDLIQGVSEVCNNNHYDLLVDVSSDNPKAEVRKLKRLLERTHGVLVVPVSHTAFDPASRQLLEDHECVLVDRYLRDLPNVACVHHDDISAGRQAARHLMESGCTRVFIIDQASRSSDSFAITPLEDRARGCLIELGDQVVVRHLRAGYDEQGGFAALEQFEKREPLAPRDGIFALTDRLAVGCRYYLATRPLPLGLPVIGTEGQAFGDFVSPPLASIGFDAVALGQLAATVLFAKLQEVDLPHSDCQPHFVTDPVMLKPSSHSGRRDRIPIHFPDAASYYSAGKMR